MALDRYPSLKEFADRAHALSLWFESQEISPADAVKTMAILTGLMSIAHAEIDRETDMEKGIGRIKSANMLSTVTFMAMWPERQRG